MLIMLKYFKVSTTKAKNFVDASQTKKKPSIRDLAWKMPIWQPSARYDNDPCQIRIWEVLGPEKEGMVGFIL